MRGILIVLGIIIGMILMYRWISGPPRMPNITSDGFGKKDSMDSSTSKASRESQDS